MRVEWSALTDEAQLALSTAALQLAFEFVAKQAEELALEIEEGCIGDSGGADALRLLTALIRLDEPENPRGTA